MDKNQFSVIIAQVYKSLTPSKVVAFAENDDLARIQVVSEAFEGMVFSERFKLLNKMLKDQNPEIFSKYAFIFEAFTAAEVESLPKDGNAGKAISLR